VISKVKRHIDDLNRTLASYEQIKRFTVLSKEFSVVDGEMTPTLKMKRNIIESKYSGIIDQMYHE
jgi:long-chain acyl-CoA synthetase